MNKQIPWIKQEDMEWVDGRVLLAIDAKAWFSIPMIVRDFGNGIFVETMYPSPIKYSCKFFTHYAIITHPNK